MRTQTITLTETEAETLFGIVAELLCDLSGVSADTRQTLDAIYCKLDDLSEVSE
jgi:hypothetical protein